MYRMRCRFKLWELHKVASHVATTKEGALTALMYFLQI